MPNAAAGKPIEVWFQDEARVGQKGGHAYVWAPIGSRPPLVRDNRHASVHLFGAICPERAVGAAIIMPAVNTEAMNEHLTEISAMVTTGAHAILVCAYLRANKLCNLVWDTYDDIVRACAQAWHFLVQDPQRIMTIGNREWARVNQ